MSNIESAPIHEHQLELFAPHAGQLALELCFATPEPTIEDNIIVGEN